MSKKLLLALALLLTLATAGCFDLFGVPGVVVSPDGSTLYFLSPSGSDSSQQAELSLNSLSINGGQPTAITTGSKDDLTSAFAVNPANGDVAYVQTGKANGTQLLIYSGGSSRELVGQSAFGAIGVGTMMRYSPDGSRIALTMALFPPQFTLDKLDESDSDMKPEDLAGMKFVLYLINSSDGSLTVISNADKERANTVSWSPSGNLLAYNAWIDSDGDGNISTIPNVDPQKMATNPGDRSQIRIYDLGAGKTTAIDTQSVDYAQTFLSDSTIAYVSLNVSGLLTGGLPGINAYDIPSGTSKSVHSGTGLIIGMSVSPDGQQVAWVESGAASPAAGDSAPGSLFVSGTDFANPRSLMSIPSDKGIPDAPVWLPDSKSVLMTQTGFLSAMIAQFSAGFSSLGTDSEATPTSETPGQQLVRINVADGTATTVYQGLMANSSYFSSVLGLVSSGALDQLTSGLGGAAPGS